MIKKIGQYGTPADIQAMTAFHLQRARNARTQIQLAGNVNTPHLVRQHAIALESSTIVAALRRSA